MRTIDEYIRLADRAAKERLEAIRRTIARAAPFAEEVISYRMPAFKGHRMLLYFAAFREHIGIFPPIHGDPDFEAALAPYRGPKGNLKFPHGEKLPLALIRRIAALAAARDLEKAEKVKRSGTRAGNPQPKKSADARPGRPAAPPKTRSDRSAAATGKGVKASRTRFSSAAAGGGAKARGPKRPHA